MTETFFVGQRLRVIKSGGRYTDGASAFTSMGERVPLPREATVLGFVTSNVARLATVEVRFDGTRGRYTLTHGMHVEVLDVITVLASLCP